MSDSLLREKGGTTYMVFERLICLQVSNDFIGMGLATRGT